MLTTFRYSAKQVVRMAQDYHLQCRIDKQEAEINDFVSRLVKHKDAFYDPKTKRKLFIENGCCAKGECNFDKKKQILKVLLPSHLRTEFRKDFGIEIPSDRMGKAVVCFRHFFFQHRKHYLIHGSFPASVRLLRRGESFKDAEDIPVPDVPPPFAVKIDKKTGILLIGFKVSLKGGHENSDWVCNLMLNSNLNFVVLPSFLKDNSV